MDPNMVALAQKAGAGIASLRARATITDRGINKSAQFDLEKLEDPNLKQMLGSLSTSIESMSMPLPEEPVGTGAFTLDDFKAQAFTLASNPEYWGGEPEVKKVRYLSLSGNTAGAGTSGWRRRSPTPDVRWCGPDPRTRSRRAP